MEQQERRELGRVDYSSRGVLVVCDTQEVYHVGVRNIGPGGVGLTLQAEVPELIGQNVILVAETMIMYAEVVRQTRLQDGGWFAGLAARKFSNEVLQYLFDSIELRSKISAVE